MIRIAILDDYQNVSLEMADWSPLAGRAVIVRVNRLHPRMRFGVTMHAATTDTKASEWGPPDLRADGKPY